MTLLFIPTVFLAAFLLFLVQPMAAKAILPRLGGSPAVWNTSMVFFQGALLLGYAYSHGLCRRLGLKTQVLVHGLVLAVGGLTLPAVLPRGWMPPPEASPIPWVLAILGVMVGGSFVAVATSGPLLQGWFSRTRHRAAADPYFLYAASNAGSLLGLLAYPVFVERALDLRGQAWMWAAGYGALAVLIVACGLFAVRRRRTAAPVDVVVDAAAVTDSPRPRWAQRGRWVLLAFIPSSLMLGVTQHLSTDVATMPLLWAMPLSIYLITFILAFSRRWGGPVIAWSWASVPCAIGLVVLLVNGSMRPIWIPLAGHLVGQFVLSMLCHRRLSQSRPAAAHLTEFYVWLAVGGMCGGILNGILAPLVFDDIAEYPIAIVLACLMRPARPLAADWTRRLVFVSVSLIPLLTFVLLRMLLASDEINWRYEYADSIAAGTAIALALWPRVFATSLGLLLLGMHIETGPGERVLARDRTFFGVLVVTERNEGGRPVHALLHGTTAHGTQVMDDEGRGVATTYYHLLGPIGEVLFTLGDRPLARRIGVIGLGTGSLAAYARPTTHMTFMEIDPGVVEIAEDPQLFTYIADARGRGARIDIVLGDGRLTLERCADGEFGILIIDAFSSDAIPVHLLTREAVALMIQKTDPAGVVALHISNRNLDLAPVVGAIAHDLGLASLKRWDGGSDDDRATDRYGSDWVVLARSPEHLDFLNGYADWEPIESAGDDALWTDQRSDIWRVIDWD